MSIEENVAELRKNIALAAKSAGRDPDGILLLAASKMNDAAQIRQAIDAGVDICGENRVQEMLEKFAQNAYSGIPLHFIGHLQKNKVKQVVGVAELIHGVDSLDLLGTINRVAEAKSLTQEVLLEVNIANEPSKSGFAAEDIPAALAQASALSHVRVRGLMAIPPIYTSDSVNWPYFSQMNKLYIDNSGKKYDNVRMDFLSMGMSGDYAEAIACGANLIRIGSAIFGKRIYK